MCLREGPATRNALMNPISVENQSRLFVKFFRKL